MTPLPSAQRVIASIVLGVSIAALVEFALPASIFTTRAVIGINAAEPSMRLAMAQGARDAIQSRPVMTRAAATLLAADFKAPDPSFAERAAVFGSFGGVRAIGREARLASALSAKVITATGEGSASVKVIVSDVQADVAAQIADAVAEAFLSDDEDRALKLRQRRESATAARMDALVKAASAAHARLISLGDTMIDPSQARADAAAQIAQAQGRLDTIRANIASATPPISDRKDVPDSVAALQRNYLDLNAQLATARETLGDRHTTIISLRDGVARASARLTAEWKRLEHIAQSETDAARARASALPKEDTPANALRRTELAEARKTVERADFALSKAELTKPGEIDEHVYRIYARAPIPVHATGFSRPLRGLIAALAALIGIVGALVASGRGRTTSGTKPRATPRLATSPLKAVLTISDTGSYFFTADVMDARAASSLGAKSRDSGEHVSATDCKLLARSSNGSPEGADAELKDAMQAFLTRLDRIEIQREIRTIMVSAEDGDAATTAVAVSLARAAAEAGRRVLIIESERARPALAAFADPESQPALIDVFGTLRVALEPKVNNARVMLAPAFYNGEGMAAALAQGGKARFIEDVAAAFDLFIIDGGQAGLHEALADICLHVARYIPPYADAVFPPTIDAKPNVTGIATDVRVFVAPRSASASKPPANAAYDAPLLAGRVPGQPRAVGTPMPRRKIAAR